MPMATVSIITKLMPDAPDADLGKIKETAQQELQALGARNLSMEEKPIAFGLKAIMIKFDLNEEKGTEIVEQTLSKIEHVSSATIDDYRRAFG